MPVPVASAVMLSCRLPRALAAWDTPEFEGVLKAELAHLGAGALPLQPVRGSHVIAAAVSVLVLETEVSAATLQIRAGVHFQSVIAGCSCADDPTPVDTLDEYSEVRIVLDRESGEAEISAVPD